MPMFEKVNALTFKLKTHLGKVGGQAGMVGEEERRRREEDGRSVEKANNLC